MQKVLKVFYALLKKIYSHITPSSLFHDQMSSDHALGHVTKTTNIEKMRRLLSKLIYRDFFLIDLVF